MSDAMDYLRTSTAETSYHLQVPHVRGVRFILHHKMLIAHSFAGGSIVRRRLPVLAHGFVDQVGPQTISIVRLGRLGWTAHIHDLPVAIRITFPECAFIRVRIEIAHEVDNTFLEKLCEGPIDGRDGWLRWIKLFESG